MANIDLTSKFSKEKPTIKVSDDLIIEVDDNHKNVLIVNALMGDTKLTDSERMDKTLEQLLGKKNLERIKKLELRFIDYQKVFFGVMAAVNDESYEDVEKRFRNASK